MCISRRLRLCRFHLLSQLRWKILSPAVALPRRPECGRLLSRTNLASAKIYRLPTWWFHPLRRYPLSDWSDSFNFRRLVPLLMKLPELRGILQYVTRFRDKVFVIAIDGEILASDNFPNILLDIAVLRSLNIKVVLVHGAGSQIERTAIEQDIAISNSDGSGVVDAQTLQLSINVAIRLTNELMEGLTQVDLRAAYANCIIAHPAGIIGGIDYQFSGKVEKV